MEDTVEVEVADRQQVADDVLQFTFRSATEQALPLWNAGGHISLHLDSGLTRQYSLCGSLGSDRLQIAVLRQPDGRGGSLEVCDSLQPGRTLTISRPRNGFELLAARRYVFIAGGIGITPLLPMVEDVDGRGLDWVLHYGGRTRSAMAFADQLVARYPRNVRLYPADEVGLMPLAHMMARPRGDTMVYACGPDGLLRAVTELAEHWPPTTVHMERFLSQGLGIPEPDWAPIEVHLDAADASVKVSATETILDAVMKAGHDVPYSCKEGHCGTCEARVLDGVPLHRDVILTEAERAANETMMICVSRACTPQLRLEI